MWFSIPNGFATASTKIERWYDAPRMVHVSSRAVVIGDSNAAYEDRRASATVQQAFEARAG
jgi:hypothetical protein